MSASVERKADAYVVLGLEEHRLLVALREAGESAAVALGRRSPELAEAVRSYLLAHEAATGTRGRPRAGATRGSRGEDLTEREALPTGDE